MDAFVPTSSPRQNSQTFSFISLNRNVPFKPLTLSLSQGAHTSKRRSCIIKPSQSPTAPNKPFIPNLPDEIQRSSLFSSKSARRVPVKRTLPQQSSFKSSSTDKKGGEKSSFDDSKPFSRKKSTQDSLRKTIIGSIGKPWHLEQGTPRSSANADDSFISMSSDRSRSYRRGFSSHTSQRGSLKSREKIGKVEESTKTARLGQMIRRKSCHCSDCGGLSKKEKLHLNVAEPCPRAIKNKTKVLFAFLSQDSRDFSNGVTPRTTKSMTRASFSSKNTNTPVGITRSISGFTPSSSIKVFKQLQTLSSFGGPENKSCRPLSRFANRTEKCTTLNVLHNEMTSARKSRENLGEPEHEPEIGKPSMRETELELQGSLMRASIEDLNRAQRSNATYISSLDLDVQKPIENKGDEDRQEVKLRKETPNFSGEAKLFSPRRSVLKQEKPGIGEDAKKATSLEPIIERQKVKWPNMGDLNLKLKSPKGSHPDVKALQKLKETRIQEIYAMKHTPFVNAKHRRSTLSQSCRFSDYRSKEENNAGKIQMMTEAQNASPESIPQKRASMPSQSSKALHNMFNKNHEGSEKKPLKNKSISFTERKHQEIKRLMTSYGDIRGYKVPPNEENFERVILKSSNGTRKFRMLAVGDSKKE